MKKIILFVLMAIFSTVAFAQVSNNDEVVKLIGEGVNLNDEGKYDEALKKFDKALKLEPKNATATYEKAYTYYSKGEKDKAKKLLEKGLDKAEQNMDYVGMYLLLATIYDEQGDPLKSIDTYKKALEIPNMDFYYASNLVFNLGISYDNAHNTLNDTDNQYALDAINMLNKSFQFRPLHQGTNYYLYQLLTEYEFFAHALSHLSMFAAGGNNHAYIGNIENIVKDWSEAEINGSTFRSSEDSLVLNKVIEIGKQPRSEYGLVYDVFYGVFSTLCADITDEPQHPSRVDGFDCTIQIRNLYAKLLREGELETFMHYACSNTQNGYLANKNWLTKNQDRMDKLVEILNEGEYLVDYNKLSDDDNSEGQMTAEEAHEHNADALKMIDVLLTTTPDSEESKSAVQFLLAWMVNSPDVTISIGDVVMEGQNDNNSMCLFAYMAGCAKYQLEQGINGFTEDAFYAGMKTMLTYYEKFHENFGSNPAFDEHLNQLHSDEAAFKVSIVKRIPNE